MPTTASYRKKAAPRMDLEALQAPPPSDSDMLHPLPHSPSPPPRAKNEKGLSKSELLELACSGA